MELSESIEYINKRLVAEFGLEWDGQPRWRVVFSDDQFELRWTNFSDSGMELINPEVRMLPKYKQYIRERYILERLVPVVQPSDLVSKISYEPAWTFMDDNGKYLPPYFEGCKFVIESVYSKIEKKGTHVRYRDPSKDPGHKERELSKIERDLFGNETSTTDSLHAREGVVNPYDSKTASENELKLAKQVESSDGN